MEYKLEEKDGKLNFTVTYNKQEWDKAQDDAYKTECKKYKMQGFRAGKAPRKALEKTYGTDIFVFPAMEGLFKQTYPQMLRENKGIKPIDYPSIDFKNTDDQLVITGSVMVEPKFTLGKYKGLEVRQSKTAVRMTDIDQYLKELAQNRAKLVEAKKDAKLEKGSVAVIDFVGSVKGVEFPGGKAENYELEIGSNSFIDTFEDQLIGMKPGDNKEVNVKFPDDYHAEDLKGAKALFKVKLNKIMVKELPEINDKFAQESSEHKTLDEFKKQILADMEKKAADEDRRDNETALMKKIVDQHKIDVPDVMVDAQVDNMLADMEYRLSRQGMQLGMYLQYMGTTMEEFKSKQRVQALDAVKTRLIFDAIVEKENLAVTDEEVDAEIEVMTGVVGKPPSNPKKHPEVLEGIRQNVLFAKIIKFLQDNNTLKF